MYERVVYKVCTILEQKVSICIYSKEEHDKCRKVTYMYDLKELSILRSFYTSFFSVAKREKKLDKTATAVACYDDFY